MIILLNPLILRKWWPGLGPLRRFNPNTDTEIEQKPTGDYVAYTDLIINLSNYSVQYLGENIEMPPKELELFYFLASHPNQVFTREQLLDHIWGYEYYGDTRTVDVHIKRLREKIRTTMIGVFHSMGIASN